MGEFRDSGTVFRVFCTDFIGPLPRSTRGNRWLMVVIDNFSKFVMMTPLAIASGQAAADFLEKRVILFFGAPKYLISDMGNQFKTKPFQKVFVKYRIEWRPTPSYCPQNNPTEASNKTIMTAVRSYVKDDLSHTRWDENIAEIACALNSSEHTQTGEAPFRILFGTNMVLAGNHHSIVDETVDLDISRNEKIQQIRERVAIHLRNAFNTSRVRYNLRSRNREFKPGEVVWRRNTRMSKKIDNYSAKLAPRFVKTRVEKRMGTHTYKLRDRGRTRILNAKDIK